MTIFLNSLETANPPHLLPQDLVERNARRILGSRYAAFERMASTFKTSGVEQRYSFAPIDWFEHDNDWQTRNELYVEGATSIFKQVATRALASAGLVARDIDIVVTVSTSGIATPTLEARVFSEMGFRNDIMRVPLFGLGCAGGVSGLSIAERLVRSSPGTNVLMVVVEACTLSFRSDRLEKADIISTVLFGDGAAAACISSKPNTQSSAEIVLGAGSQHLWPDTLDIMAWNVDPVGLGVVLDKSVPAFVREHMKEVRDIALKAAGMKENELSRHVFHPGGAKVAQAVEEALGLQTGTLDAERHVLKNYGNMSAPTVLFVLKEVLKRKLTGKMLMGALGPGFTASFMPIEIAA
ncbi:MAG: type III polyketide synthase [Pseudomonadota bacterium]